MRNAVQRFGGVKETISPFAFHAIRKLEQCVSPDNFYMALAPFASARAAFSRSPGFPEYFTQPPSPRATRRARMNYLLSRALEFIPDRLATPKWQARFQTTGLARIQEARERKRSVVLVCFHFGAFKLIPFWLRALGIPVIALLGGAAGSRSRGKQMKDRLSPFPSLPTVFYKEDQLRSAVKALHMGHVLFLAADREAGKQITVPINEQWSFQMPTGAIRLAARCDAELIPCCMIDEGRWQFRLEIGRPVPSKYLTDKPEMKLAAQHLLDGLLPYVRQHPELCTNYLVNCFHPVAATSVEETFAA